MIRQPLLALTLYTLCVLTSSCTVKVIELKDFDKTKPLTIKEHAVGFSIEQNGQLLKRDSFIEGMRAYPQASQELEYFTPLAILAISSAGIGGAFVGLGLAANEVYTILRGAIFAGSGILLGQSLDQKMIKAAEIHNQALNPTNSSMP